jgi:hypothetical protein
MKPKHLEETCLTATWPIINFTRPDLRSNPGRRIGKLATSSRIHDAEKIVKYQTKERIEDERNSALLVI